MRKVPLAVALMMAGALTGAPAVLHAQQVHPGETQGLGLRGPDTPDMLKKIAADPYRPPTEPACETIPAELVALNKVLGVDADQAKPKPSMVKQATKAIAGAVRGMIPYRDEVRFLTRADHKDHELMDATRAAWARRGFLRGLEASLHCAGDDNSGLDITGAEPLGPGPDRQVARLDVPPVAAGPAFQPAPDQPWELPPPSDEPAGATAVDPAQVRLVAPADEGFEHPGR